MTKNETTGKYEQIATVNGDFNLHVECSNTPYSIELFQKTAGSDYAPSHSWRNVTTPLDVDCICKVSPKSIKVVCDKNATATITQ